jgi:hypothetical protein
MDSKIITQEYLQKIFDYKDGNLYWKIPRKNVKVGLIAGGVDSSTKYLSVKIDGKKYKNHRIIYFYHKGFLPKCLDHIDGNPQNNRIENLREATHLQNSYNMKLPITNKSGVKGVCWDKNHKKWFARVSFQYKEHFIGYFDEIDKAKVAIIEARNKLHGEFARHI